MSEIKERLEQLSPLQRAAFALKEMKSRLDELERQRTEPMALVGMACRFPGGVNCPNSYWRLLRDGVDAIGDVPADRWDVDAFYHPDPQVPGKMNSRYGGFVKDVDQFDNHFFSIPDEEARMLDPQQRMLLQVTWEALEDAGIPPHSLRGTRTGVFLGISASEYSLLMSHNPNLMNPYFSTGTALSIAANRISFAFDWHGPSMAIDTACSSSLVALHLASQAIRNGECDTAIVGGSSLILTPTGSIVLTKFGLSASDGRIRAFDKSANGYVRSEGVGVVVLQSKQTAESGGMRTYAFVRGSAVSQTGRANGLSAPVGAVQESTMRAACEQAGVAPGRLAFVETQGTGTLMGDAIEAKALGEVLVKDRPAGPPCPIGSVKTNLGHLEAASGIASVMKVALSLTHGELPASLHFQSPNPMIPFDRLRLRVPTEREPLLEREEPVVASVNAFGYGGSTAHVVLEASSDAESPLLHLKEGKPQRRLLPISARTVAALRDLAEAFRNYLDSEASDFEWPDICAMATHGREHHDCRLAIIAESTRAAARQIDCFLSADGTCETPLHGRRPYARQAVKAAVKEALREVDAGEDEVTALAKLYLSGGDEELSARSAGNFTRLGLPHYAWQRQRHWIDESSPYQGVADAFGNPMPSQPTADNSTSWRARPDLNVPYVAPQTRLQSRIASAWSRVLGVDPVGIHDNFFELGGQSLQAAMLISELRSLTQTQLDPIALYESQTVEDLAACLDSLCRDDLESADATPANLAADDLILPVSRAEPLPLSFGQERFWFMDQLLPAANVYNTHLTVPLHGSLDRDGLQTAITQTISRHESLRTTIQTKDGEACQQILEPAQFDLAVIDLSDLDGEQRDEEVGRLSQEQARTAFRLNEFPLFRMKLLRLTDREHVLLLTIHHIVVDGVSLAILLRDLLELYHAGMENRVARLPDLPVQYADFAVWQRDALQCEILDDNLHYWRGKLAGIQPVGLPFDRSRSSTVGPRPGTHKFTIPADLLERLQAVCRRQHVTPFMLMLAAFKTLLFRYSSQADIVVGVPVAGRGRHEVADVVGFFVNTLAIRTVFPGNPKFSQLLEEVRDSYFEGLVHQDMPFDRLATELEPEREPNRSPVFQVLFNYLQHVDVTAPDSPKDGLSIGKIPTEQPPHGGELDLVLTLAESGESLDAILGFNASLFDHASIEATGNHLIQLLQGIADDEEQPLSRLPLLSESEIHKLTVTWNDTSAPFSADKCLHELVEAQAKRTPGKKAVICCQADCDDRELTFDQLNRRANQVAHLLRNRGVVREELVGVCLPRSVDAVVSLLGILKAGAAFLPIDWSLPSSRIETMLADSHSKRVITCVEHADHFKPDIVEAICLSESLANNDFPDDDLDRVTSSNDLAYCIFTSGSTGRPKGVLIEHRSIVNVVESFINSYALDHEDRILQNTSLSFDVSINEIFPALCSGATIVVSDEESQVDAARLAGLIADKKITIAAATPTVLTHLNREADSIQSLRLVLSGGEALSYANIDRLAKSAVVTNGYGPTETCIAATCHELNLANRQESIPIGRPLANYRIYVVDNELALLPPGCPGELCIAGIGLARGYAADPQLTLDKFVECPFEPGQRMYRTGDLARWRSDGKLEFLGRLDRQIKLRGLRIELSEIESALQAISKVESAVVLNYQPMAGDPRLVAYIVPSVESAGPIRRKLQLIADGHLDDSLTYEMPNGLEVIHQNDGETEFLHRESFEHDCHLSHGIEVFDGCCVFDVGANIGVFALHVAMKCQSAKIHGFEPIPSTYSKLQLNAELHGLTLKAHQCGIADHNGEADFVYFPDSGAMSGSFVDSAGLQQRIADVRSAVEEHVGRAGDGSLAAVLTQQVEYETHRCQIRTISDVIRAERVQRIDLLKIDVEHGERAALAGIRHEDWPKIQQVVVEVHDAQQDAAEIAALLRQRGFDTTTDSAQIYEQSKIVITHVYARRIGWTPPRQATQNSSACSTSRFIDEVVNQLGERLPQYMIPSCFELLAEMPLKQNGKIDQANLPSPADERQASKDRVLPRSSIEKQLATIWSELLSTAEIGIHDNFFELGGHSLLATQLVARVNQAFNVELRLRSLFENATIARLSRIVSTLQESKQIQQEPIRPAECDGDSPLSSIQQSMWLIDQTVGSSAYEMNAALVLAGLLDIRALERAVGEVFRRHEVLRTTFPSINGQPIQQVAPYQPIKLSVVDVAKQVQQSSIAEIVDKIARDPVHLETGPIVRIALLRIDDRKHVLVIRGHHIVFDAWSAGVLTEEIATTYQAFVNDWRSPLAELEIQYRDYVIWQRDLIGSDAGRAGLDYWRNQLAGIPRLNLLALPHDPPAEEAGDQQLELPSALSDSIEQFCQQRDLTPFMLMLTALQIVLAKHSGQELFPVGTLVSGRSRPETQSLIGCFVNPLVIRCDVSEGPSFEKLAERVRTTTLQAFDHQETPFGQIVEAIAPIRETGHPLFQVLYHFQHEADTTRVQLGDLEIEPVELKREATKFDLAINVQCRPAGFRLEARYDANLYDQATAASLLEHMRVVLVAGLADPQVSIATMPWISAEEQSQIDQFSGGAIDESGLRCVHEHIQDHAERTPSAIAVVCSGKTLTYEQLNSRANQLAHHLRSQGVGRGDFVGVFLRRSLDLPVAILATWKAGASMVPLEPDYPPERLSLVVEDCAPRAIITEKSLDEQLHFKGPTVCLDRDRIELQRQSKGDVSHKVALDDAMYAIYTSGSTGRPKGTVSLHRGLANLMAREIELFDLGPNDHCLSRCPIGFDIFIEELLRGLGSGGRFVLANQDEYRDSEALARLIHDEHVTQLTVVPSIWDALLDEEDAERKYASLRCVSVGGDVLSRDVIKKHFAKLSIPLYNDYGPAETSIWLTGWSCDLDYPGGCIPIGRPMKNMRVYILDQNRRPVAVGVEGEIYIGGIGVGSGYLNRDELTAERFLTDPFLDDSLAKMYRSGDHGRWLPDGNIEFLGRRDGQVKIRGVRIEIGEIEAVLKQFSGVKKAVADVRLLPDGNPAIAAYLVEENGQTVTIDELRTFVQRRLPRSMHPATYLTVEGIPLSINGKVDRSQLPDPQWLSESSNREITLPRSETERLVELIWRDVLELEQVGVHENFFELGGHSLLLVKTMSCIQRDLEVTIPLAKIFAAPTVAQLAIEVDNAKRRATQLSAESKASVTGISELELAGQSLVHLGPGDGPPLFIVHGMGGYSTNLVQLGHLLSDIYDVFGLEGVGPFDDRAPRDSVLEMASEYVQAIRQRQPQGPYQLAGWSMGGTVAWEMAQQLIASGETVGQLVLVDSYPLWNVSWTLRSSYIGTRLSEQLGPDFADIRSLPKQQRWQALVDRVATYSGAGAATIRRLVRTCEAHQAACASYVPEKLDVDVVAIWAKQRWGRLLVSQWRKRARSYVARTVAGDHYGILESPHVEQLADKWLQLANLNPLGSRKVG